MHRLGRRRVGIIINGCEVKVRQGDELHVTRTPMDCDTWTETDVSVLRRGKWISLTNLEEWSMAPSQPRVARLKSPPKLKRLHA